MSNKDINNEVGKAKVKQQSYYFYSHKDDAGDKVLLQYTLAVTLLIHFAGVRQQPALKNLRHMKKKASIILVEIYFILLAL